MNKVQPGLSHRSDSDSLSVTDALSVESDSNGESFQDAKAAMTALQATGLSFWEALTMVGTMPLGADFALGEWMAFLSRDPGEAEPFLVLTEIANSAPVLADQYLQVWLRGRHIRGSLFFASLPWIRSLPAGLTVDGDVVLTWSKALERLPDDLYIGGSLELVGCAALKSLPAGLRVGGNLWVVSCQALQGLPSDILVEGNLYARSCGFDDSRIPPEARIHGRIVR